MQPTVPLSLKVYSANPFVRFSLEQAVCICLVFFAGFVTIACCTSQVEQVGEALHLSLLVVSQHAAPPIL